jgi:hypothetical protein
MNCSWKSMSGPFSISREKTIPKRPEVVAQRDASTDKTAVHFRSSVDGKACRCYLTLVSNVLARA